MSRPTVQDKALQLQAAARVLKLRDQDEEQTRRIATRVSEVRTALEKVSWQVATARLLGERTGQQVDLSCVCDGHANLARRANGGLPEDPDFTRAKRRLDDTAKRIATDVQEAWASWAKAQIEERPLQHKPMLQRAEQVQADVCEQRLRQLAAAKPVTAADIRAFKIEADALDEILANAPDAPEGLVTLMHRIDGGTLTLADVSDDDIALLRQCGQDTRISLTRKED